MAGMTGMEGAAIRQLARNMDDRAAAIEGILRATTHRVTTVEWAGTDRERFVGEWDDQHAPKLAAVAQGLRSAAEKARLNANEQERISRGA